MTSEWITRAAEETGEQATAVKLNNNDKCRASLGNAQGIESVSYDKIILDTEQYDPNGIFDDAINYRCVPTKEGYYLVVANVTYATSPADGKYFLAMIVRNGTWVAVKQSDTTHANATPISTGLLSTVVYMNGTTDRLELYASHNFGSPGSLSNDPTRTFMAIHRLSYSS